VIVSLILAGCTEANPLYVPPDSGADRPPGDGEAGAEGDEDVDAGPDAGADVEEEADVDAADAEADVEEEADAADAEADVEEEADAADAEIEAEADGADAEAEAEADVPSDDDDLDGVPNDIDNCPDVWNPRQEDCDGDGIGDACEGGDIDGDTIPDAIDLCACGPGTGTHDEDGDGTVDECDNCPLVPNPLQENSDLDGLGDACEPPTDPGRVLGIDRFEPFVLLPSDPGWFESSGTWVLGADVYEQTSPIDSAVAFYDPWGGAADVFVQAVFRVTALGPGEGATSKQAGVLARTITFADGTVRWYSCGLNMARDRVEIRYWDGGASAVLAWRDTGTLLVLATDYRVSFLVVGSRLACSLESPVAPVVTATATSAALPFGAPGLRTHFTTTTFSGLMVAR
jgi:hypothetical protein